ncbi:MAG: hypothetical protein KA436_10195 [Oligoflexales bacterium]|nr:hypothetical protein [Oligoflexales bacterium]
MGYSEEDLGETAQLVPLKRWLVLISFFFLGSVLAAPASEHLSIEVGQSQEILIPAQSELSISRRGVIDVHLLGEKKISATGLRAGFVVITLKKMDQDDYKYFVEVKKHQELSPKDLMFPGWVCKQKTVLCDEGYTTIRGLTDDFRFFYRAKDFCEKRKECEFLLVLSERAREELKSIFNKQLGDLADQFEVKIYENGAVLLSFVCPKEGEKERKDVQKNLEHINKGIVPEDMIQVSCQTYKTEELYVLSAKVFLVQKKAAQELGLQSHFEVGLPLHLNESYLETRLYAFVKENKAEIIGEPLLWMHRAHEARVQSGGEQLVLGDLVEQTEHSRKKHSQSWKEYGLDLKASLEPLSRERVLLRYSFILRNPGSESGSSFHLNRLESEVQMKLGESSVVGGVQFQNQGDRDDCIPVLSSLPIIGPFFKLTLSQKSESQIYLSFVLRRSRDFNPSSLPGGG